jgi:hypothetical protein
VVCDAKHSATALIGQYYLSYGTNQWSRSALKAETDKKLLCDNHLCYPPAYKYPQREKQPQHFIAE